MFAHSSIVSGANAEDSVCVLSISFSQTHQRGVLEARPLSEHSREGGCPPVLRPSHQLAQPDLVLASCPQGDPRLNLREGGMGSGEGVVSFTCSTVPYPLFFFFSISYSASHVPFRRVERHPPPSNFIREG